MLNTVAKLTISRETLPEVLAGGVGLPIKRVGLDDLGRLAPGRKQLEVAWWGDPLGDPFPDLLVVHDSDFADTEAWLAAYMAGLAPISQWCRVWRASEVSQLQHIIERPSLGTRLAPWVGAIIAEYGSQNSLSLRDSVAASAIGTARTFAAARATALTSRFHAYEEVWRRHEALGLGQRDPTKRLLAEHVYPLWYVLAGDRWVAKAPSDARSLELFADLFKRVAKRPVTDQDDIQHVASVIAAQLSIPELRECAIGPQGQRVEALDRLVMTLMSGPKTSSVTGILGLGASLIDPGASFMPELLRRHASTFPAATLWAGAFAGVWSPFRVLSDHNGLGRSISKQLLSPSDLMTKPVADVSFEELSRWTGASFSGNYPVRGLLLRTLFLELFPGVTVPIPAGRAEPSRTDSPPPSSSARQPTLDLPRPEEQTSGRTKASTKRGSATLEQQLNTRVERLEKAVQALIRSHKNMQNKQKD